MQINNNDDESYYAVIFTSIRTNGDHGYELMAAAMMELAQKQAGFLSVDSAREDIGITVSYWTSLESIKNWKAQIDHTIARNRGREQWYSSYTVRICKVVNEYSFDK